MDKLDDANGLQVKLQTFERLLTTHPGLTDRVVLVQVTSCPIGVTGMRERMIHAFRNHVQMQAVRLNSRLSRVSTVTPVVHITKPMSFGELCALYCVADVALVTPIRGGVNPVS